MRFQTGSNMRVREPERQQVLHRLLAEVVVDAVDLPLVEDAEDRAVEGARGLEVVAERLLDHHAHRSSPSAVQARRAPSAFTITGKNSGAVER